MGSEYYSSVSEQIGASTPDFFRLFMVPGMFHCSGGVGAFSFDPMTPLVQWVEKGQKPERLIGAQMARKIRCCRRGRCALIHRWRSIGETEM